MTYGYNANRHIKPEGRKLLKNLEDLKLIYIRKSSDDAFLKLVNKFRARAKKNPPTLAEITKEIELVRAERYGFRFQVSGCR